jgi:hypothetical protein
MGLIIADEVDRYPVGRGTGVITDLAVRPQQPLPQRPERICPVCGVLHLEGRR